MAIELTERDMTLVAEIGQNIYRNGMALTMNYMKAEASSGLVGADGKPVSNGQEFTPKMAAVLLSACEGVADNLREVYGLVPEIKVVPNNGSQLRKGD